MFFSLMMQDTIVQTAAAQTWWVEREGNYWNKLETLKHTIISSRFLHILIQASLPLSCTVMAASYWGCKWFLVWCTKHSQHVSYQQNIVCSRTFLIPEIFNKMHSWYLKETYFFSLAMYAYNIQTRPRCFSMQSQSFTDRSECLF